MEADGVRVSHFDASQGEVRLPFYTYETKYIEPRHGLDARVICCELLRFASQKSDLDAKSWLIR